MMHSFASRGMGVDYASNFDWLMVGIAGNLSLNVEDAFVPDENVLGEVGAGFASFECIEGGQAIDVAAPFIHGKRTNDFGREAGFDSPRLVA